MEKRKSERVSRKAKVTDHPLPWVYEVEMQRKIETEAYLLAEKDGFRNHPHHYWVAAERDFGCCAP